MIEQKVIFANRQKNGLQQQNGFEEPGIYTGFKQICLSVGNDLETFITSGTE